HREEVGRGEDVPVRVQKLAPRRAFAPLGSRLNPVPPEDGGDRAASNIMTKIRKRALDARVTPVAILGRHAHNQPSNLGGRRRASWPAGLMTVVLSGDEMTMPCEQGVRTPVIRPKRSSRLMVRSRLLRQGWRCASALVST